MASFATACGLAVGAVVLLATGVFHIRDLRGFVAILRQHRLLPAPLAPATATAIAGLELSVGIAAAAALVTGARGLAAMALTGCLCLGAAFLVYLRLLVNAGHVGTCGCTPLPSRLTPASFAPAGLLVGAAGLGLIALAVGPGTTPALAGAVAWSRGLPVAWGLVLTAIALLLPSTAPGNAELVRSARFPYASRTGSRS